MLLFYFWVVLRSDGGCLVGIQVLCGLSVRHGFCCHIFLVLLIGARSYSFVYFLCLNWVLIGIIQPISYSPLRCSLLL